MAAHPAAQAPMPRVDAEFQSLIPPLTDQERSQLEANLVADGCRDALLMWRGALIDGHNRLEICTRLGIPFETRSVHLEDRTSVEVWILRNQLGRRNLSDGNMALIGGALKHRFEAAARKRQGARKDLCANLHTSEGKHRAAADAAELVGVSPRTVAHGARLLRDGVPELVQGVRDNRFSVSAAALVSSLPKEEQRKIVAAGERSVVQQSKQIRQHRQEASRLRRIEKICTMAQPVPDLSVARQYPVLLADPPWRYQHSESVSREIENHYPTMTHEDLCALPVGELATDHAILFMWATSPKLSEAMGLLKAWGFDYKTCAVWMKDKIGMGYYYRQKHELLLVATKGQMPAPPPATRPASVFEAARTEHSRKPGVVHEQIGHMYPNLPRIELFARRAAEGWDLWGNEV